MGGKHYRTKYEHSKGIKMKVYSRNNCPPCQTLRYWLEKNNIKYELIDIDQSPALAYALNIAQVPYIVIGDHIVQGLNIPRLKQLLKVN